jgi:hypothetical protein
LQWRSTCTGQRTKRRTRRTAETGEPRFRVLQLGACTSKSACGRRSLPQLPLDIRCRRCVRREGRRPVLDAGPNQDPRSDADPRRSTPSRRPGCLPPLQPRRAFERRIAPYSNLTRWSLAHAAHTFSTGCGGCLHGHCKHQSAVTRDPWHSRNRPPFLPMGSILSDLSCLGLKPLCQRPKQIRSETYCEARQN